MNEVFSVIHNIFNLAFAAIPDNFFVVILPFVAAVGAIRWIRS